MRMMVVADRAAGVIEGFELQLSECRHVLRLIHEVLGEHFFANNPVHPRIHRDRPVGGDVNRDRSVRHSVRWSGSGRSVRAWKGKRRRGCDSRGDGRKGQCRQTKWQYGDGVLNRPHQAVPPGWGTGCVRPSAINSTPQITGLYWLLETGDKVTVKSE